MDFLFLAAVAYPLIILIGVVVGLAASFLYLIFSHPIQAIGRRLRWKRLDNASMSELEFRPRPTWTPTPPPPPPTKIWRDE